MLPKILIPGRIRKATSSSETDTIFTGVAYCEALQRAGAQSFTVAPASDPLTASAIVDSFDGVLILGGPDVDSSSYLQAAAPQCYGTNPAVDAFEFGVIRAAIAANKPLFGICRGLQVLNVACGGSLHQHLPHLAHLDQHSSLSFPDPAPYSDMPIHTISLQDKSLVQIATGTSEVKGISAHHQGIDQLGRGLVATGHTADGLIEVIQHSASRWITAVQWHPELSAATDPDQQALFNAFVAACNA